MGIGPLEGVLLGSNLGRSIVTSGNFTAYVCDSALFPNYFGQTCFTCKHDIIVLKSACVTAGLHRVDDVAAGESMSVRGCRVVRRSVQCTSKLRTAAVGGKNDHYLRFYVPGHNRYVLLTCVICVSFFLFC